MEWIKEIYPSELKQIKWFYKSKKKDLKDETYYQEMANILWKYPQWRVEESIKNDEFYYKNLKMNPREKN